MTQANLILFPRRAPLAAVLFLLVAGCDPATQAPPSEPGVREATRDGPAGAAPGSCWGRIVYPAVIETITEQVQIIPAKRSAQGSIISSPVYRTETQQRILTPRRDDWFETPCREALSPEVLESLQRALQARAFYNGPISGRMDPATRAAVRRFQREDGLDSEVLSLAAARRLGLIAVPRS